MCVCVCVHARVHVRVRVRVCVCLERVSRISGVGGADELSLSSFSLFSFVTQNCPLNIKWRLNTVFASPSIFLSLIIPF